MIVENINIKNFRNIKECFFSPNNKVNVIYGENGNGKTSLIESIYCVSNLKSFRTSNLRETIRKGNDSSIVECTYNNNRTREVVKLEINKKDKKYTKNDKTNKIDDYLWSLFTIVFVPDDLNFINGSPGRRRELIDKAIFFTDKNYINIVKKYNKVISNKNYILKNNKTSDMENWNTLLARYSSLIVSKRNEYIDRINDVLIHQLNEFKFSYKINKDIDLKYEDLFDYFTEELSRNVDREIKYKYSIVGAHRQEIDFSVGENNLKIYGSQGMKRLFVLLFRSAQILDFNKIHNFEPILLLDDMASELDRENKNIFYKILEDFSGQTFITTTDKKLFSNSTNVKYFCVENGNIKSFI